MLLYIFIILITIHYPYFSNIPQVIIKDFNIILWSDITLLHEDVYMTFFQHFNRSRSNGRQITLLKFWWCLKCIVLNYNASQTNVYSIYNHYLLLYIWLNACGIVYITLLWVVWKPFIFLVSTCIGTCDCQLCFVDCLMFIL